MTTSQYSSSPPQSPPNTSHFLSPQRAGTRYSQHSTTSNSLSRLSLARNDDSMLRKRSMVRPERARSQRPRGYEAVEENGHITLRRTRSQVPSRNADSLTRNSLSRTDTVLRRALGKNVNTGPPLSWWVITSRVLTCCFPGFCLKAIGKKDKHIQQAFREKLALCLIISVLMLAVGFLTFGFQEVVCGAPIQRVNVKELKNLGVIDIRGEAFSIPDNHPPVSMNVTVDGWASLDFTRMFQKSRDVSSCGKFMSSDSALIPCTVFGSSITPYCHLPGKGQKDWPKQFLLNKFNNKFFQGVIWTDWSDVIGNKEYVVYSGDVLRVGPWDAVRQQLTFLPPKFLDLISQNLGRDATAQIFWQNFRQEAACLTELYKTSEIDSESTGCVFAAIVLNISLVVIAGVVIVRFVLAVMFAFIMGWRLGSRGKDARSAEQIKRRREEYKESQKKSKENRDAIQMTSMEPRRGSRFSVQHIDGIHKDHRSSILPPAKAPWRVGGEPHRGNNASPDPMLREPTLPNIDYMYLHESDSSSSLGDPSTLHSYSPEYFQDLSIPVPDIENDPVLNDPTLMHSLIMVPCYSEGEQSLRTTLDSVSNTYYPATHKCLFVVADGIIQGAGNPKPTSDILIDMMEVDERFRNEDPRYGGEPQAYSYVAIADGSKRKNFAKVYAGWYKYSKDSVKERRKTMLFAGLSKNDEPAEPMFGTMKAVKNRKEGRVPMLLIVKCGNDEEQNGSAKPGNRGKRDSQVIMMNFLTKVMFDDRMTELEFDIFFKLWTITGVHPERYETVLFVDADTMVYPDSMTHMVAVMLADPKIMGLCGETKIANKWGSWVSMIQVFEYYISHHLAKAFESVFGGVTCLPGCFSMLRIKAPKGPHGYYVPILANPDIVEEYSENVVDTLHKKNLLLLGEDRYLSTLMLRTFPKRKMMFVPLAICKTIVPDEFRVLLSQRRRWINSTIHNLLELLLVKDLCGTFCISMQFVIFMELVGTVVLPAAISFTIYLCITAIVTTGEKPIVPLILLAAILGLPAVLIVLTASRWIYVFWMFMYLFSLPIWNFVLPLYAFWNFDDFTWGETRKTLADKKGEDHGRREGDFDGSGIHMRRWSEWLKERKLEAERLAQEKALKKQQRQSMYVANQQINNNRASVFIANSQQNSRKSMVVTNVPPGAQVIMTNAPIVSLSQDQYMQLQQQQNNVQFIQPSPIPQFSQPHIVQAQLVQSIPQGARTVTIGPNSGVVQLVPVTKSPQVHFGVPNQSYQSSSSMSTTYQNSPVMNNQYSPAQQYQSVPPSDQQQQSPVPPYQQSPALSYQQTPSQQYQPSPLQQYSDTAK